MIIGKLRERVTIQQESLVSDDMGGSALTWVSIATNPTVWARIEQLQGREALQAMALQGPFMHRVWLRYRTDLTIKMRILFGTRIFNIRSIEQEEKRAYTQAICEEGVAV